MTTETKKPARLSIHMTPVESSQIKSIGYDPAHQTLAIVFTRGEAEYHYPNVTQDQFDAFKGADSLGVHFGKHFKPRTDFIKHHPHKA